MISIAVKWKWKPVSWWYYHTTQKIMFCPNSKNKYQWFWFFDPILKHWTRQFSILELLLLFIFLLEHLLLIKSNIIVISLPFKFWFVICNRLEKICDWKQQKQYIWFILFKSRTINQAQAAKGEQTPLNNMKQFEFVLKCSINLINLLVIMDSKSIEIFIFHLPWNSQLVYLQSAAKITLQAKQLSSRIF